MLKLLKDGHCFIPEDIGKKDILVVHDRIYKIQENMEACSSCDIEVLDCADRIVCPGFIDQHVHITGGGGEEGPVSRIPELMLYDLLSAGVTTVVGVLGVDGITRTIGGLLAKARALESEGVTAYIYTGSYGIPTATLTGKIISDLTLIDKVIGVGEIAVSDHRSSHPTLQMLREVAYEANVGGLLGGKAGVVHIHVGDGKKGILPLIELINNSDFPKGMFVPTHLNRNRELFSQAVQYINNGGNADLTAGEKPGKGLSVPDALEILQTSGVSLEKVTVSSDGNGSIPAENGEPLGIGKVSQLFNDIRQSVLDKKINLSLVLKTVTSNVAKVLKIFPEKGCINSGSCADILVLKKEDLSIDKMLVKGELLINAGKVIRKGRYEK